MFKLHFPSGATVEFAKEKPGYQGTLYIWPEDIQPLLEAVEKEKELDDALLEHVQGDKN